MSPPWPISISALRADAVLLNRDALRLGWIPRHRAPVDLGGDKKLSDELTLRAGTNRSGDDCALLVDDAEGDRRLRSGPCR